MERIVERVCGIDVHKATLSACVRVSSAQADIEQEVRSFGTTGDELLELRQWLQSFGVTQVAMEATGVYWKPVYYVLEEAFSMVLVNPAEVKQLPGRKTDVADCAWLAQLLEHGLLRSSLCRRRPSASYAIWCAIEQSQGRPCAARQSAAQGTAGRRPQALQCDERRPWSLGPAHLAATGGAQH